MSQQDSDEDTVVGELPGGTRVIAASQEHGRALLTSFDDFVENQSRFDHQARVCLQQSVLDVSRSIYLDYVASQVMQWTSAELSALKAIVSSVQAKYQSLEFSLPEKIVVVKTTGQEEGHAAYTRMMNVIALPENMIASVEMGVNYGDPLHPAEDLTYLENVFIHETFHLFSKNNRDRRDTLYAKVGYKQTPGPVQLPDVPWPHPDSTSRMPDFKITNPDTPELNAYIELEVPVDGSSRLQPLMPILVAKSEYRGGSFFDYLEWYFMLIEQDGKGDWQAVIKNNRAVLFHAGDLQKQYLEKIGYNLTGELFHPDEVLAQNFVFVANLPSLNLLQGMASVLKTQGARQ